LIRLRISRSFSFCEIAGSLAGSITCALTAALDRGAIVTSGNPDAVFCCAAQTPAPAAQSAISTVEALMQFIFRMSLNYRFRAALTTTAQ
jgi:hypothetical protein